MSKPVKRVLLTNDDGWRGPGLQVLEEIANEIAEEVWIVSPDLDQSGVSMSISVHHPLQARLRAWYNCGVHCVCVVSLSCALWRLRNQGWRML